MDLFSSHFTLVVDGWTSEESKTDLEKLEEAAQNKEESIKGVLLYHSGAPFFLKLKFKSVRKLE